MSDSGGGGISVAVIAGAGVGGCAIVVGIIALAIYCYMKARREKSKPSMTKSPDVFTTETSNPSDYPRRSRVNQYPDPEAARKARKLERERERDMGHVNPAYTRHGSSETSSISSDVDGGRDISPPRARRPRGGAHENEAFSSGSSIGDSSSLDDGDVVPGYSMEREVNNRQRRSYKMARQTGDLLDNGSAYDDDTNFKRGGERRRSRRDEFQRRNPRSDSPLTVAQVSKHDEITRRETEGRDSARSAKSRKRESSPSSRTYDSSVDTGTTLGTEFTATTKSSGHYQKNPSFRRSSPSRSSSHRRYKREKDETDSKGRRKPRRTRSADRQRSSERQHRGDRSDRSRSPGGGSHRSNSSSRHSGVSSRREAKQVNKEQAMLPIFSDTKGKKKSSAV